MLLDSNKPSTCFKSRRYQRGYLLQSLNRDSPRSKPRSMEQGLSNVWLGASALSSCLNQFRHCPSLLILFSQISSLYIRLWVWHTPQGGVELSRGARAGLKSVPGPYMLASPGWDR